MADGEDAHSSLEVVPGPTTASRLHSLFPEDPVFLRAQSPREEGSPSQPSHGDSEVSKLEKGSVVYGEQTESKANKQICGLSPLTFWILVALIFILCAGAIGGGVGGSVAVQSQKSNAAPAGPSLASNEGPISSSQALSLKSPGSTITRTVTTKGLNSTKTLIPTTVMTSTKFTTLTTSLKSAPKPIPTENSISPGSSFKVEVEDMHTGKSQGLVRCGGSNDPCELWLQSAVLYGWYSHKIQYINCHGSWVLATEVNVGCLDYDAGFSVGGNASLFHGQSAVWWWCGSYFYVLQKQNLDCEAVTLQVIYTYLT